MRVVHLSTFDQAGGAARAALRLHRALRLMGVDSTMLVAHRTGDDPHVVELRRPRPGTSPVGRASLPALSDGIARRDACSTEKRTAGRDACTTEKRAHAVPQPLARVTPALRRWLARRPADAEFFSDGRSELGRMVVEQIPPCDVLHLQWIARFVDHGELFAHAAERGLPIVWTLHDCNAFTGGCHVAGGCERFATQCGACPQLGSHSQSDLSRAIWRRKRAGYAALGAQQLHVVSPSLWLAERARRSSLLGARPIDVIPNGVDVSVFRPGDRDAARAALDLPAAARVVLFCAYWLDTRLKGFALFREALHGLRDVPNIFALIVGRTAQPIELSVPHRQIVAADDECALARIYQAADVLALPSLEDNLPNTALEALACGLPVVAFAAGGIPEAVRHGDSGLLAPVGDTAGLRDGLRRLLADAEVRQRMGGRARQMAQIDFDVCRTARSYKDLYQSAFAADLVHSGAKTRAVHARGLCANRAIRAVDPLFS